VNRASHAVRLYFVLFIAELHKPVKHAVQDIKTSQKPSTRLVVRHIRHVKPLRGFIVVRIWDSRVLCMEDKVDSLITSPTMIDDLVWKRYFSRMVRIPSHDSREWGSKRNSRSHRLAVSRVKRTTCNIVDYEHDESWISLRHTHLYQNRVVKVVYAVTFFYHPSKFAIRQMQEALCCCVWALNVRSTNFRIIDSSL